MRKKLSGFTTPTRRVESAAQSALGEGARGLEIFVLALCSLQFAMADSAATLPQQYRNK